MEIITNDALYLWNRSKGKYLASEIVAASDDTGELTPYPRLSSNPNDVVTALVQLPSYIHMRYYTTPFLLRTSENAPNGANILTTIVQPGLRWARVKWATIQQMDKSQWLALPKDNSLVGLGVHYGQDLLLYNPLLQGFLSESQSIPNMLQLALDQENADVWNFIPTKPLYTCNENFNGACATTWARGNIPFMLRCGIADNDTIICENNSNNRVFAYADECGQYCNGPRWTCEQGGWCSGPWNVDSSDNGSQKVSLESFRQCQSQCTNSNK